MRSARAIVFDLDDTLYRYRAFLASGFRAVASRLEREYGLDRRLALRALRRARLSRPGHELQDTCAVFGLPASLVPTMVQWIRDHEPSISLPGPSVAMLRSLRDGWRVGVLTNGIPAVQQRKIAALGVSHLADTVLCAAEYGDGTGKPAPEPFLAVLDRLGVQPASSVFVGNDLDADIAGAAAVGMRTIYVRRPGARTPGGGVTAPDVQVTTLDEVPAAAAHLIAV